MNLIEPSRIIELKARVKAECARRKYVGSVAEYSEVGYDFIESGENSVLKEGIVDFDKIIEYNENRLSENEKASIFADLIEAYNYYEF